MRYGSEHKQRTHQRVLQAAARAIRVDGPQGVGVSGVMAEAGLTRGGFYAHFASKDALVAAAIGRMFEESRGRFARCAEGYAPAQGLARYIDFYLSDLHCAARGQGCAMAALASDLPRLAEPARRSFVEGAARLTAAVAERLDALGVAEPEQEARSMLAEMVGAVVLARVEIDAARATSALAASRRRLKRRFGLDEAAA